MENLTHKTDIRKSFGLVLIGLAYISILALADVLTMRELSLSLFYLLPLALAAWHGPLWVLILLQLAAGAGIVMADLLSRDPDLFVLVSAANDTTAIAFITLSSFLIRRIRRGYLNERALARTDPLTSLANFRQFRETASSELERARRYGYPTTIVYFDLDGFKSINDTLGHEAGDTVLIDIAKFLKAEIRTTDLAVRFGGDEFGILMPQAEFTGAHTRLEEIRKGLGKLMESGNRNVTVSMGAVTWLKAPESLEVFLSRADEMMYEAKNGGKNQLVHIRIS